MFGLIIDDDDMSSDYVSPYSHYSSKKKCKTIETTTKAVFQEEFTPNLACGVKKANSVIMIKLL